MRQPSGADIQARLRGALYARRVPLNLALRVTTAALLALAAAQALALRLPLWAVLTAIIVTQLSVGRSLKATLDYLAGTLGGAIYGGAVASLIPHQQAAALFVVLAIALAPLTFAAAINPMLAAAPVTAVIVILLPAITHASLLASAIDRVLEVVVGGAIGLLVSLLLLPLNAHALVARAAADLLDDMARATGALLAGLSRGLDVDALHAIQDGIGQDLDKLAQTCTEAERERSAGLALQPDTRPLHRTLQRLRHDLVMMGRAATAPMPGERLAALAPPLAEVRQVVGEHLRASGAALLARRPAPNFTSVDQAFDAYGAALTALREAGLTRPLSADATERVFTLAFAFEQMRRNLTDLDRCIAEWATTERRTWRLATWISGVSRTGRS